MTPKTPKKWVEFHDMCSGGRAKEVYSHIYIEADDEADACRVFYHHFGHSASRVTCTCCGEDYSVTEYESLHDATAFDRNCKWDQVAGEYVDEQDPTSTRRYIPLDTYLALPNVLVLRDADIPAAEHIGDVPKWLCVGQRGKTGEGTITIEPVTSHRLAKMLLEMPDLPVVFDGVGKELAKVVDPVVVNAENNTSAQRYWNPVVRSALIVNGSVVLVEVVDGFVTKVKS